MKTAATDLERKFGDGAGDDPYFDHIDGIIRNNLIFNLIGIHMETGIELMNVTGVQVYHNTVASAGAPFNSIECRWSNTTTVIKNNLCTDELMLRDGAQAEREGNMLNASLAVFEDFEGGDLHLSSTAPDARDKGVVIADSLAGVDMDGEPHGARPDIGADESNPETAVRNAGLPEIPPGARSKQKGEFSLNGQRLPENFRVRTPAVYIIRSANPRETAPHSVISIRPEDKPFALTPGP
jgi:hypothetical protein